MAKKSMTSGTSGGSYWAPKACNDTAGAKAPYGHGTGGNYVPQTPSQGNAGSGRAPVNNPPAPAGGTKKLTPSKPIAQGRKTVSEGISGKRAAIAPAIQPAAPKDRNIPGSKSMDVKKA